MEFLEAGDGSLAALAKEVSYSSESGFSTAFTETVNCRPGNDSESC